MPWVDLSSVKVHDTPVQCQCKGNTKSPSGSAIVHASWLQGLPYLLIFLLRCAADMKSVCETTVIQQSLVLVLPLGFETLTTVRACST